MDDNNRIFRAGFWRNLFRGSTLTAPANDEPKPHTPTIDPNTWRTCPCPSCIATRMAQAGRKARNGELSLRERMQAAPLGGVVLLRPGETMQDALDIARGTPAAPKPHRLRADCACDDCEANRAQRAADALADVACPICLGPCEASDAPETHWPADPDACHIDGCPVRRGSCPFCQDVKAAQQRLGLSPTNYTVRDGEWTADLTQQQYDWLRAGASMLLESTSSPVGGKIESRIWQRVGTTNDFRSDPLLIQPVRQVP